MNLLLKIYKRIKIKHVVLLVSILITLVTIFLFSKDRKIGYDKIPTNNIFDERNYALQGISIRETGIPIGYSDSGDYINTKLYRTELKGFSIFVNGIGPSWLNFKNFPQPVISVNQFDFGLGIQHLKLVQPFVDHSPLGGLLYSLGINQNAKNFMDITPGDYRRPTLYLAIVTSILLFLFVYQTFKNPIIATLSVIVYSSVPTYLLASRYALLENVVAPLALLMLNLILLSIRSKAQKLSTLLISLAGLISGLAVLTKESAVGFFIAGVILLLVYKSRKVNILFYLGAGIVPILVYILWGTYLFPSVFFKIFIFNASRGFLGSLNFINTFSSLGFKNFSLDGWWIWGFISFIFLIYKDRDKGIPLLISFFCGLFVILFFAGQNYLWYYLALIPLLAASSGYALWKLITKPDPVLLTTFFLFAISSSFYWGYTVFHLPANAWAYRGLVTVFTGAATLRLFFPKNKTIIFGWIILFIFLVIILIKWNHSSILYILTNWQTLEIPAFPRS